VWSAGDVTDLYGVGGVQVTAPSTYPTTGHLLVAGVSSTSPVSLWRAVNAYFTPDQITLPESVTYPEGQPIPQVAYGQNSSETQLAAEAAALRLTGSPDLAVQRAPRVVSVVAAGPSYNKLLPGDIVDAVGGTLVASVADFSAAVASHSISDTIQLTVTRDGKMLDQQIDVVAVASNANQQTPSLGVTMTDSFLLGKVEVQNAPTELGSGLMLAIAVYDIVTPGPLLGGLSVAGAGIVDSTGVVSAVSGAQQRLEAAQEAGADVFLLPATSCATVSLDDVTMTVVAVSTLGGAVSDLKQLAAGGKAVTSC
jgi:PDZ domain-containing protein